MIFLGGTLPSFKIIFYPPELGLIDKLTLTVSWSPTSSILLKINYSQLPYFGKFWCGEKIGDQIERNSPMLYPPITSFYTQLQLYKQFVNQYFILQLVRISPFASIPPHQKFPMYDIYIIPILSLIKSFSNNFSSWKLSLR